MLMMTRKMGCGRKEYDPRKTGGVRIMTFDKSLAIRVKCDYNNAYIDIVTYNSVLYALF